MVLRLDQRQKLRLRDALCEAFDPPMLKDLLASINRNYTDYVTDAPYPTQVFSIVNAANLQLWWMELLLAARDMRPSDPQLIGLAQEFGLAPMLVTTAASGQSRPVAVDALEGQVRAANPMVDMGLWLTRVGEIEGQVCRVECPPGTPVGTGFLVGPDVVITNFHVVRKAIEHEWSAADLVVRFDYKSLPDGVSISAGMVCQLASDWLIDYSPYSAYDVQAHPLGEAGENELDYALLRLREPVGSRPRGADGVARGWIRVPASAEVPDFALQKTVYIVQHPGGSAMQISIDSDSVLGIVGNGTRLRHSTTTASGSSGSPCFGTKWQWIALHHSGDPMYPNPGEAARYNEGILVTAILKLLATRGKAGVLG